MNYCDGCDTAKHCSKTPEHKRPCQNMEKQAAPKSPEKKALEWIRDHAMYATRESLQYVAAQGLGEEE